MSTYLCSMEKLIPSQLRNMSRILSISLIFLRLSMMMCVWKHFINICEEIPRSGLDTFNLNPLVHGKNWRVCFRSFGVLKKKSLDLQLTKFYALKRKRNETISTFSRRFASIYYKFPKEIQPIEVVSMLHYATTFHLYLSFLMMERRPKSLHQIFNDD